MIFSAAIATSVVVIGVLVKKSRIKKLDSFNNPSYYSESGQLCIPFFFITECACFFTVSKPKIEIIRNLRDIPASIPAQNYKNSTTSDISTQPRDITYANVTVANLHQSPCESSNESIDNPNGGVHPYDFTVIYADPTSPSYVVGVFYTCRT